MGDCRDQLRLRALSLSRLLSHEDRNDIFNDPSRRATGRAGLLGTLVGD